MNTRLQEAVLARLRQVIDPETGADVVRMRLVEGLNVDEAGVARYRFRPSSPLCPLAVILALQIYQTVAQVEGITDQDVEVVGYVGAKELNALLHALSNTGVQAEKSEREAD
jgi:metal-sulfur cluster biosynthetic enzyme